MDFETWFDTLTITDGVEYMSIIKEVAQKAFEAGRASQLTPVAADKKACPAEHEYLLDMGFAPKFCPVCGERLSRR